MPARSKASQRREAINEARQAVDMEQEKAVQALGRNNSPLTASDKRDIAELKARLLEKQKHNSLLMLNVFSDASVRAARYLEGVINGTEEASPKLRIEAAKVVLHHFPPALAVKLGQLESIGEGKDLSQMTPEELKQFIELGRAALQQFPTAPGNSGHNSGTEAGPIIAEARIIKDSGA